MIFLLLAIVVAVLMGLYLYTQHGSSSE